MKDIIEWPIIKQLNEDFLGTISFVYVYNSGKSVICVTDIDKVYSYGDNTNGFLGLGHKDPIDEQTLIEELCDKSVCDIKTTYKSVIALTKTGNIYSWSLNTYGQLGNGTEDECLKPGIITSLTDIVKDIKYGHYHCLALTQNGEVFEWGWSVTREPNLIPIKVIFNEIIKISAISCGMYHSLALTDNGQVFSWGLNDCGQCGRRDTMEQIIPFKINLNKIMKIMCGWNHNLLLTENKDIYACGQNFYGQIGNGMRNDCKLPVKINDLSIVDIEIKYVDIATVDENISIGKSSDGFCYVWGECGDELITKPKITEIKTIDEALICYSKNKITFNTYYLIQTTRD